MTPFNSEIFRFGTAAWAAREELKKAGHFQQSDKALFLGFHQGKALFYNSDAPLTTIAGSGAGKFTKVVAWNLCLMAGTVIAFDPKGELTLVAKPNAVRRGEAFYSINPFGLHGEPNTKINLLGHLVPNDPNVVSKTKSMCEALIPKGVGTDKDSYFSDRASEFCEAFVRFDLERNARTSVTRLYGLVNTFEGNEVKAARVLREMARSDIDVVRRIGGEIERKFNNVPKELSGILGTIYQALAPLSDPRVAETFDVDADLDVKQLLDGRGSAAKLTFIVPAQNIEAMRSIISMFFVQIESIKADHPGGDPVTLIIDEAGQLRGFNALLRFYTYGRGNGLRTWSFFQSVQQIDRNLGNGASDIVLTQSEAIQLFGLERRQECRAIFAHARRANARIQRSGPTARGTDTSARDLA